MRAHQSLGVAWGAPELGTRISMSVLNQNGIVLFPEDVGTTSHPVLARLAATSGTNDVRNFWKAFDIPVVSHTGINAVNFRF